MSTKLLYYNSLANYNDFVTSNGFALSIFLAGSFLNYIPVFIGGYSMADPSTGLYSDYLYRLSSFEYSASLVASLATTIPILADYLFDCFLKIIEN